MIETSESPDSLIRSADLLMKSGEYKFADQILSYLVSQKLKLMQAIEKLAICRENLGNDESAARHYEIAIAYSSKKELYQRLSRLYSRIKKWSALKEVLERYQRSYWGGILDLKEKCELLQSRANVEMELQNSETAIQLFMEALELDPYLDGVRSNLGFAYLQAGQNDAAIRCFQDALAANPENWRACRGLSFSYLREHRAEGALAEAIKSLDLHIEQPDLILLVVKISYSLKSYSEAARILSKIAIKSNLHPNYSITLAGLQFHLGRIEESRETLRKVLMLNPGHREAGELQNMVEYYATTYLSRRTGGYDTRTGRDFINQAP